jgi:hypothetical protein
MTNEQTHTTEQVRALAELVQNCIIKDANFYGDLSVHYGKGELRASGNDAVTVGEQIAKAKYAHYVTKMDVTEYGGIAITVTVKEAEATTDESAATDESI